MHTLAGPAQTRVHETHIGRDRDGDWLVDTGATAIGHYHGDTVDTMDLFTIDAPDPMTPDQLRAHIAGCRALLAHIETPTTCTGELERFDEARAIDLATAKTRDQVTHQLDWAARFPHTVDAGELAVWRRAQAIQGGAA